MLGEADSWYFLRLKHPYLKTSLDLAYRANIYLVVYLASGNIVGVGGAV